MNQNKGRLRELAIKYLDKLSREKDFDKRDDLLIEHQRKHDRVAKQQL